MFIWSSWRHGFINGICWIPSFRYLQFPQLEHLNIEMTTYPNEFLSNTRSLRSLGLTIHQLVFIWTIKNLSSREFELTRVFWTLAYSWGYFQESLSLHTISWFPSAQIPKESQRNLFLLVCSLRLPFISPLLLLEWLERRGASTKWGTLNDICRPTPT